MASLAQDGSFELIAGNPALDLVNTLDWRFRENGSEELLNSYDDLLRFAAQAEMIAPRQIKQILRSATHSAEAAALVDCRALREAAADVFYAIVDGRTPSPSQLKCLDRMFKEARGLQHLAWSKPCLQWEWPASECDPYLPMWMLTIHTEKLLLSDDMKRLRACEKPDCRWLFLDTSKNHTRRWCDMKLCGNRMKARRFKAQHKA
ncbi:MAG TPA: CGNR zinc finger domain-containing protein [Terracidiphilus sp.]|jgi:predicted RNA-binding Zn ribbon-like protein